MTEDSQFNNRDVEVPARALIIGFSCIVLVFIVMRLAQVRSVHWYAASGGLLMVIYMIAVKAYIRRERRRRNKNLPNQAL
jgi:membrane associated rhomboid family serine protease